MKNAKVLRIQSSLAARRQKPNPTK